MPMPHLLKSDLRPMVMPAERSEAPALAPATASRRVAALRSAMVQILVVAVCERRAARGRDRVSS